MVRHLTLALCALAVSLASARAVLALGCPGSMTVTHMRGGTGTGAGGFDLRATAFFDKPSPGPAIRFWAHGNYAKANSGTQQQFGAQTWLADTTPEYSMVENVVPHLWISQGADWYGADVAGCPLDLPESSRRTVFEMSFSDPAREGTKEHQGFYLVVSTPLTGAIWDLDAVRGGGGPSGNVIPAAPIPAPKVVGAAKRGSASDLELSVELPAAVSYSEGGKDAPVKLIKGYRLMYAKGTEPTSSDPAKYLPVHDPKEPGKELGLVRPGMTSISLPAADELWLVAQLVYDDPSPLYSASTSGHVRVAGAAGSPTGSGSGRKRGEPKKK